MSSERNKKMMLEAYAALNSGDIAAYLARVADDVEWTFFGSHRFARTFRGKEDVLTNLLGPLSDCLDGMIKLHISNAIAYGDYVVIEAQGEARSKEGLPYNNQYCIVLRLKNDRIVEVREYLDTELAKRIFG